VMCRCYGTGERAYYRLCYQTGRAGEHVPAAGAQLGKTGRHVVFGRMAARLPSAPVERPYSRSETPCIVCRSPVEHRQIEREVPVCLSCERKGKTP